VTIGTILILQQQSVSHQWTWFVISLLFLGFEYLVMESILIMEYKWIIPYLLLQTLNDLHELIIDKIFDVHSSVMMELEAQRMFPPSTATTNGLHSGEHGFQFVNFAFLSSQVVHYVHQQFHAGVVINCFKVSYPTIVTSPFWPEPLNLYWRFKLGKGPRGSHDTLGYLIYGNFYLWFVATVPMVGRLLIRYGSVGLVMFCLSKLVQNAKDHPDSWTVVIIVTFFLATFVFVSIGLFHMTWDASHILPSLQGQLSKLDPKRLGFSPTKRSAATSQQQQQQFNQDFQVVAPNTAATNVFGQLPRTPHDVRVGFASTVDNDDEREDIEDIEAAMREDRKKKILVEKLLANLSKQQQQNPTRLVPKDFALSSSDDEADDEDDGEDDDSDE
jgi:hypothetical protein